MGRVLLRIVHTHTHTRARAHTHAHNNNNNNSNKRRFQGARCPSTNQQRQLPHPAGRKVQATVKPPKKGKSAGVDNIPSELFQAGGEVIIDIFVIICNKIWRTGEWPTTWTQCLIITLPKKGNLQLWQNHRTISLVSHPRKVVLRILINRHNPQAEEIIKEEQAGFREGRSTTEHIFNPRILCEKYLQHQQKNKHPPPPNKTKNKNKNKKQTNKTTKKKNPKQKTKNKTKTLRLRILQEGVQQSLARRFVDNHEAV